MINKVDNKELVAAFIEKRLQDNLAFFKKYSPDIYQMFSHYEERNYFLIYDQEGSVDILNREDESLVYGGRMLDLVFENLKGFIKSPPHRPYISFAGKDKPVDKTNYVHTDTMWKLGQLQAQAFSSFFTKKDFSHSVEDDSPVGFGELPKSINSLFVFSTGVGFDVEKLICDYSVKRLYILEPNPDIFYASMQLVDWGGALSKIIDNGGSVYIGVSEDKDQLITDLTFAVNKNGRHNATGAYLYSSFYKDDYKDMFVRLKDIMNLSLFNGYGFYDDSRISLAHTLSNFRNKIPCILSSKKMNVDYGQARVPVFIVGNGPSLDDEIDFLKENSNKAVIISCGTSLKALYVNNIVPDFHMELERTAHIPYWIKKSSDEPEYRDFLKKITFVGMSQVHPEAFSLFGCAVQVPKDVESGSFAINRALPNLKIPLVSRVAPSCVHVALTMSVIFGFKKLYFFGVDMGYKSEDSHHSKFSLYSDLNDKAKKHYSPKGKLHTEFESNFSDGVVMSSGHLPMFKDQLESIIAGWKENILGGFDVMNCSDGALIKGAEPCHSSEINFDDFIDKEKFDKGALVSAFFSYVPEDDDVKALDAVVNDAQNKIVLICDWAIREISNRKVESIESASDLVDRLSLELHSDLSGIGIEESDSWLYSFFDGSLLYMLSAINSTIYFPAPDSEKISRVDEMFDVVVSFFESVKKDAMENILTPDSESYYDLV